MRKRPVYTNEENRQRLADKKAEIRRKGKKVKVIEFDEKVMAKRAVATKAEKERAAASDRERRIRQAKERARLNTRDRNIDNVDVGQKTW